MQNIMKPVEVDLTLRWPAGKTERLAKQGKIPHLVLLDGAIRFSPEDVDKILADARRRAQPDHVTEVAQDRRVR